MIAVIPANRAKSLAILPAERPSWQVQQHLLAHGVLQQQAALFIIPDFCLIFSNCVLSGLGVDAFGAEDEIEVAGQLLADGFEAAGAELFELAFEVGAQADVVDKFPGAAMLDDEVGLPFHAQGADLPHVEGVIDSARRQGFIQLEGLVNKLCGGDEHVLSVGPGETRVNGRELVEVLDEPDFLVLIYALAGRCCPVLLALASDMSPIG